MALLALGEFEDLLFCLVVVETYYHCLGRFIRTGFWVNEQWALTIKGVQFPNRAMEKDDIRSSHLRTLGNANNPKVHPVRDFQGRLSFAAGGGYLWPKRCITPPPCEGCMTYH